MPIPINAGVVVDEPTTPDLPDIPSYEFPPRELVGADRSTATYIAPDGTRIPLTTPEVGWWTLPSVTGVLAAAKRSMASDANPRGGSKLRGQQALSRTVTWTIHVYGDTRTEFLERWWELVRAITMTGPDYPGQLLLEHPSGVKRVLYVMYQDGLEEEPEDGYLDTDAVIQWWSEDPYWADADMATVVREFGTSSSFFAPYPTISSGQVLGATVINNPGAVEAWPTFKITGPASSVVATLASTGESWTLNPNAAGIAHGNLLAGEVVTVDTNYPVEITGPDGSVWNGALNWPDAVLWSLAPGDNSVTFTVNGAAAGTKLELAWRPRHETG